MSVAPSLFISYSHESSSRDASILEFAQKLRQDGVAAVIDKFDPHPKEGWTKWMEKQLQSNSYVVICPSERYLREFNQASPGKSGARYEGGIISSILLDSGMSFERFGICLFAKNDIDFIPLPFKPCAHYEIYTEDGYTNFYRWVTTQPEIVPAPLGKIRKLEAREIAKVHLNKSESDFHTLCRDIYPLMRENKRIFENFGPNSNAGELRNLRTNFEVWQAKKWDTLVPNNKIIKTRINISYDSIPEKHMPIFDRLLSHIDAFEVHVSKGGISYRDNQFPKEVVEIVIQNLKNDGLD